MVSVSARRRSLVLCALAILVVVPAARAQVVVAPEATVPLDTPAGWSAPLSSSWDVAAGSDGRAVAIWTEAIDGVFGSRRKRAIATRVFTPGGGTLGAIHRVAVKGAAPLVGAGAAAGAYLATWSSGPDGGETVLYGRMLDADGASTGSIFQLSGDLPGDMGIWFLTVDNGAAGHTVAWSLAGSGPFVRRVAADGALGTTFDLDSGSLNFGVGVAATADGGFVAVSGRPAEARGFTATGAPKPPLELTNDDDLRVRAVAASPAGDVVAAVFIAPEGGPYPLLLQRFTSSGTLLGLPVAVHEVATFFADVVAAFDRNGNLYVAWTEPSQPPRARAYDQNGQPLGPAVAIASAPGAGIVTARSPAGDFINLWRDGDGTMWANVVSLCVPGSAVCGDGIPDPFCEVCDTGAALSDTAPDACRTGCVPARCGDGVTDGGEACDDGNLVDCDGCTRVCTAEVGLGCGDGIPYPQCGEPCDDGNAIAGDGCAACTLERAAGGGSTGSDCFAAWSIDNPANEPRYAKKGGINGTQVCTDDDPRCDFDGGVPGGCTFHVGVCVNNTDQPGCEPGVRVASFELRKPSAADAAKRPEAAAIRQAFAAVVPGSVIGTSDRDVCSPPAAVPVALRGTPGSYIDGRVTISARSTLYDARSDTDKLRLECRPAP